MVPGAADKEANNTQARSLVVRNMENMSDASQRKEKQNRAIEKPKLDNARKMRGIYFIDPTDAELELKETAGSHALQDQEKQVRGDLQRLWQSQDKMCMHR